MSDLENLTMDRLLKRIYALHKQSLNEAHQAKTESTKLKENLQRSDEKVKDLKTENSHLKKKQKIVCFVSEEKVKDLEAENNHLKIENRRLSTLEETKQTSNGGCCEVIRQSLQMVISSYKELLENKDHRIKELEEQLVKYKRRFTAGDSLNWTITEDSVSTRTVRPENSPDSTSRFTPVEKTQTTFKHGPPSPTTSSTAPMTNFVGKVEVRSPEESNGKKRLQRRAKRSRYSEEISPEHKRPKLKSDNSPQDKETEKQSRNVIVHDTCYSEKDREHSHTNKFGNNQKKPGILEETVLIVPETLAVDFDYSEEQLDDEDIRLSQPYCGKQLSRIDEMGETVLDNDDGNNDKNNHQTVTGHEKVRERTGDKWITSKSNKVPTDSQKKGNENNKEINSDKENYKKSIKQAPADCKRLEKAPAESERLSSRIDDNLSDAAGAWINPSDKDKANNTDKERADITNKDRVNRADRADITNKDRAGITDKDNKAEKADREDDSDRSRLRSVLSSPDTDGHNSGNDSLYEAISDIGANVIDDLEVEGSQNKVKVSQSKVKVTEGVKEGSSGTHPLGGRCRNMEEVNELFETPGNKSYQKVRKLDTDVAEDISNDKAKDVDRQVVENRKSLFKKSSKVTSLSQEDVILRRSPRKKKDVMGSKIIESAESNIRVRESPESGRGREPDILSSRRKLEKQRTSSSGESVDHDVTIAPDNVDNVSLTDNQSMDFYHVVPVKNGQPLKSKQFDVKIKKNKNGANKYGAKNICNDRATSDVRLNRNSPSVVGNNNYVSRVPEVITISSPSVGSVSDPESPLLLKDNKKASSKDNKTRDTNVTDQHNKTRVTDQCNNNMADSNKVTRSRSNIGTNQTNNKRVTSSKLLEDDVDDDDLLMDSPKSKSLRQTTLTQRFFSPEPKLSRNTKNNENARKSRKGLRMDKDVELAEDVISIPQDDVTFKRPENPANRELNRQRNRQQEHHDHHQPLHDISSKHLNGTSSSLNGSLDPAAELSMLCREPDADENEPIKSLPSLDTDFCKEDLLSGSESLPKTSTLVTDDCEDIPSSYRFMPKKKTKEPANKENLHVSLDDSFDRPPKKAVNTVANIEVVRKKDERQKLQGYGCKQCEEYYKSAGRNDDEIQQHMNKCSRHRAQFLPPDTPPHFWSVGFIDTQECVDRGYMKVDDNPEKGKDDGPPRRRRRRLNKVFKSKTEGTMDANSDDDLVYE